jgi:natural product biosynthesis luciferase-like monooxygenase protein
MDLSKNESYETALITRDYVLSVPSLKNKIADINSNLQEKGILPLEKVIVFISDEVYLFSTLWALINNNVTCIPVNPAENRTDLNAIRHHFGIKYIITEKQFADVCSSFELIVINNEIPGNSVGVVTSDFKEGTIPFVFYNETDNLQIGRTVSGSEMISFFKELDTLSLSPGNDIVMLSRCIPYSRLIMELIWASSRGIPVVIDSLDGDTALSRYTSSEDQFEMDFGLFYFGSYTESSDKNKYKLLFDTVKFADNNSFGSIWTPERHFNEFGGLFPNPSVLSAALAVSTSNVQIRSGSLVSPLHHPVRIAEDWSLVDNLSNGRVAISFASGWQCDDFIFSPEHYSQRHEYMLSQIQTVKRLWKGETLPFKNGLGKETDVSVFPKPVQKELPVWITVSGRTETFIDAGKIGANILTHLLWQDTDELIEKISAYRKSLQENGFDPRSRKVSVMVHTFLGVDNITVKDKVREPLKNYIRTSTQLIQSMVKSNIAAADSKDVVGRYGGIYSEIPLDLMDELAEIAFNRFFDHAALLGTIAKAKELIRRLKDYDVDEIAALIDFGLNREEIMEGLTYLNELRKMYDKRTFSSYPVTITHCSSNALKISKTNSAISDFLASQKGILAEAGTLDEIPPNLLNKIKTIHTKNSIDRKSRVQISEYTISNASMRTLFSSPICEEF